MLYGILNGLFILHHQKLFSHFEICFSFKEPLNAAIMVADELTTFYKICIFSSISLAIFIYSYSLKKTNFIFKKSHYFILIFSLAASLLLSFQKSSFLGQGAFIIRNYLKCYKLLESKAGLEKPDRIILKSTIKKDHQNRPNILLILNESLASQYLEGEEGRKVAPFHHNFFQKYSQELFRFKNAISNSGATDVSLPSLLTGLSPLSTRKSFHNNPLPWDYAKSLGYKTSLHSSHSLNWANFETFFINKNLDTKVYKETLNEPLVNDLGMDDNILVDSHLDYLESLDGSAPFFSILHLNVNHTPYFTQSKTNKFNNSTKKGRYLNSILKADKQA